MRYPVRLTVPPGADLYGELGDWLNPIAIRDGVYETTLPVGLYAFKAKLRGAWVEPTGRTRSVGGERNAVLSVGGTVEPILFAPAMPCVREEVDGTVRVLAAVRRGHGERLRVRFREDPRDGFVSVDAAPFTEEDEHVVFSAVLPASTGAVELEFELDGARVLAEDGAPLRWTRPSRSAPPWLRNVYTIFVDRFRRVPDDGSWGADPGRDVPAGGNLDGITASLDELRTLGVEVLYLTPIQLSRSCHRYDLVDPLRVDPALGGEEAFARLIEGVHAREMRLLLDFSFVHVGEGFPPYEDVRAHGRASPFSAWFQWRADGSAGDALRHYGSRADAPLLDLHHPDVRALALATVERLARLGVDGFRFDAIAEVPMDLACAVRSRLRAVRPEAVVLGEVVPPHAWRWRAEGAVDVATDFAFHALATDFVAKRSIDAAAFAQGLRRAEVQRGGPDATAVRFLSTHDHPRFASMARLHGDERRTPLGLLLLLVYPGIPALLYGEEHGLSCADPVLEPEHAWGDRMPMPWGSGNPALRALVAQLFSLRRAEPALARGSCEVLFADGPLLVLRRRTVGSIVDVALNASDEPLEIDLEDDDHGALQVLATVGDASVRGQTVVLGANAAVVARRVRSPEQRARREAFVRALPVLRDRDFAAGSATVVGRPLRLDFSVTERCNLRCAHCLTLAPQKTAEGTARTMSHAVLERLYDDLAHASWFGFVHGGESLTSPVLFEVLAAIRSARGGAKSTVHLLTNGKLLRRATTERLVDLGVSSLFVSLDGATAATNDRVRVGGDFHAICANVRDAVAVRRQADLRIGLSYVVLASNRHELVPFVELAADLGVDWIKLEEPVAATPFARAEMIDVRAHEGAIAAAIARARSLGLIAVDHAAPPPIWRCELDERARAFVEADEFANRTEIHPCRAAWERACVFPNGDVSVDDFLLPVVGNVLQEPLARLWTSPAAQRQRERARASWICAGRPTCTGGPGRT
ncbi:MAG: radical SAM protein [Deltaproteobacteria bacterium]|nr:radical SAM protein [Deltaproteobacteria bacterium]